MADSVKHYEKCSFCRVSHTKGKNHVYSKHHRKVLQDVITKFSKKISWARQCAKVPTVHGLGWEADVHVWCYFCQQEVLKHQQHEEMTTVEGGGLILHLASASHKERTLAFWREQRLKIDSQKHFLFKVTLVEKFLTRSQEAVGRYLEEERLARRTEAARIERQDVLRRRLMTSCHGVMSQIPSASGSTCYPATQTAASAQPARRTVAAKAEGLTVVTPVKFDESVGNIHSGGVPPWLRADDSIEDATSSSSSRTIGPTEEDLRKRVESERKRKLPAHRVGAKFDHQGKTGATWLPSFGRVWSNQRRTHGQNQFSRKVAGSQPPFSSSGRERAPPTSGPGYVPPVHDGTVNMASATREIERPSSTRVAPPVGSNPYRLNGAPSRDRAAVPYHRPPWGVSRQTDAASTEPPQRLKRIKLNVV